MSISKASAQFEDHPKRGKLYDSQAVSFIIFECNDPLNKEITCEITELSIKKTGRTRDNEKVQKDICRVGWSKSNKVKFREQTTGKFKSWVQVNVPRTDCGLKPLTRFIVDESQSCKPSKFKTNPPSCKPYVWKFIRETEVSLPENVFMGQSCASFNHPRREYRRDSNNVHLVNCKYIEF